MNKNVFMTGGSSALGFPLLKKALAEGNKVLTTSRNPENVWSKFSQEEREAIEKEERLGIINIDLSGDAAEIEESLEKEMNLFFGNDRIDVAISNAGEFLFDKAFAPETVAAAVTNPDPEAFCKEHTDLPLVRLNYYASALVSETALKRARRLGQDDRIVLCDVGSVGAVDRFLDKKLGGTVVYNAIKAAGVQHVLSLAKNEGVKVRVSHPGPFGKSAEEIAIEFEATQQMTANFVAEKTYGLFMDDGEEKVKQLIVAPKAHPVFGNERITERMEGMAIADVPKSEITDLKGFEILERREAAKEMTLK